MWFRAHEGGRSGAALRAGKVDPVNDYLALLDALDDLDPAANLAEKLAAFAAEPIQRNDALALLVLAEKAAQAKQWPAAAQLYALTMVSSFIGPAQEAYRVEHAKRILLLMTGREAELGSAIDLLLYGHRRMTASLRADGMHAPHMEEWTVAAVGRLLRDAPARVAAMQTALGELGLGNNRVGKKYQSEVSAVRNVLTCALRPHVGDAAQAAQADASRRRGVKHLRWLRVAVAAAIVVGYVCRHTFPLPVSPALDRLGIASWLRGGLIAWAVLLVATWVFARFESIRTQAYRYLSPCHLLDSGRIVTGEVVPFYQDGFFHVFQWVWLFLLVIAWMLFRQWQTLEAWLPTVRYEPAQNGFARFVASLAGWVAVHVPALAGFWTHPVAFLGCDILALGAGVGLCVAAVRKQRRIQRDRIGSNKDFYWWDFRINPTEWWIRLAMVGLDMFLVAFLVVKVLLILFAAIGLVAMNTLPVAYFAPDGVGGLKNLTDVLMYLSWIVFLFGMFVFASLYMHWNLHEYRASDLRLVYAYIVLVALLVVPLTVLDHKLGAAGEDQIRQLAASADPTLMKPDAALTKPDEAAHKKLDEVAKYVQNVGAVRAWKVSAVHVGILGNPVLPLGFQFVVILLQSLGRAGKLPRWPGTILGDVSGAKGGDDAH